jgi:hypothetical protein
MAPTNRFPSVLERPPPLARELGASYGEMSRRSGVAAEEDNHSDISPFRINDLRAVLNSVAQNPLQILQFRDAICIQRFTGSGRLDRESNCVDLLISSDHLRAHALDLPRPHRSRRASR